MFEETASLGKALMDGLWALFGIYVPGFSFTFGQLWLGVLLASISILVVRLIFGFGGGSRGEPPRTSSTNHPRISKERRIESADANNDGTPVLPPDDTPNDKYPVGSYVDADGNVWSSDGELLLPGEVQADPPPQADILPPEELDPPDDSAALEVTDQDTLVLIAGLLADIAKDPAVWYVQDLRPAEPPASAAGGLKSLVTSIFGEYTPVASTTVITQTVDNDTYQYLIETVPDGAAGVDYEWLAGVFLFGILLYCLMRLLGGVLK